MRRALLVAALVLAPAAHAWDSSCSKFTNKSLAPGVLQEQTGTACASAGPVTARERWIGPVDEHRRLWELTREKAGLPAIVSATNTLTVFTGPEQVSLGENLTGPTLVPVPFEDATQLAYRSYSVGEFTQLPDFSWALWDWASGHETCPLEGATSLADCHDFAAHMGPVNSNHFVPQSREYYRHYHQLALARAGQCHALSLKLAGTGTRFTNFQHDCELEALTLEAVAQHYLQDSWSMGHMWERWGSSTLADFPGSSIEEKRDRAVLTALVAGFFHGARSVLQALPTWTTFDVNDAMCAPWDGVRFKATDGTIVQGVGDDYLDTFKGTPFDPQSTRFFQCAVSGLMEVYSASGELHGAAVPQGGFVSVDPTGADCFGQRATNEAIALGAAVNLKIAGLQSTIPIDARFVSLLLPKVARASGKVAVSPKLRNEFRFELQRAVTVARLTAKDDPQGTTLASGQWGSFMGAKQNSAYTGIASYTDAPWPWQPSNERTLFVWRTFHRAHAADWCDAIKVSNLNAVRARAQDPQLPLQERAVACTACTELVVRHLRIGTPSGWDTAQEPLCSYLTMSPPYVYFEAPGTTEPLTTASRYCCR